MRNEQRNIKITNKSSEVKCQFQNDPLRFCIVFSSMIDDFIVDQIYQTWQITQTYESHIMIIVRIKWLFLSWLTNYPAHVSWKIRVPTVALSHKEKQQFSAQDLRIWFWGFVLTANSILRQYIRDSGLVCGFLSTRKIQIPRVSCLLLFRSHSMGNT